MSLDLSLELENQEDRKAANYSKMSRDFFAYLPSEIILNIFSRLPAKCTMRCKCVCKPWLDLLTTPEFIKSHLSRSVPGLAVYKQGMHLKPFKIVEFVDEVDPNCDELRWNTVFNLDFSFNEPLHSSVNGLIFLCKGGYLRYGNIFLCNPITREYIKLPSPREVSSQHKLQLDTFGFGVSKITGQYKVVRIFCVEKLPLNPEFKCDQFECQVYTIGTGSWRRIASDEPLLYVECGGVFLNGNLNFLAKNDSTYLVSCLDLETELFSSFVAPPFRYPYRRRNLSVLRDCLCVCDNSLDEFMCGYEIDIWLMKEYGDVNSWTKEFVLRKENKDDYIGLLSPVKVFKDGSILMELGSVKPLYYSSKTRTIEEVDLSGFGRNALCSTATYTPSFLPLKTLAMKNVCSF